MTLIATEDKVVGARDAEGLITGLSLTGAWVGGVVRGLKGAAVIGADVATLDGVVGAKEGLSVGLVGTTDGTEGVVVGTVGLNVKGLVVVGNVGLNVKGLVAVGTVGAVVTG